MPRNLFASRCGFILVLSLVAAPASGAEPPNLVSSYSSTVNPDGSCSKRLFHRTEKHTTSKHNKGRGVVVGYAVPLPPPGGGFATGPEPDPHAHVRAAQIAQLHALEAQRIRDQIIKDREAAAKIDALTTAILGPGYGACPGAPIIPYIPSPAPPGTPGVVETPKKSTGQLDDLRQRLRELDRRLAEMEQRVRDSRGTTVTRATGLTNRP